MDRATYGQAGNAGQNVAIFALKSWSLVMVAFVIVQCRNMHYFAPHRATAAEALISLSAVVQEGSPKH